ARPDKDFPAWGLVFPRPGPAAFGTFLDLLADADMRRLLLGLAGLRGDLFLHRVVGRERGDGVERGCQRFDIVSDGLVTNADNIGDIAQALAFGCQVFDSLTPVGDRHLHVSAEIDSPRSANAKFA